MDIFAKIEFASKSAVASTKVGDGVKSEGELIISGTKGYVYVPAPGGKLTILNSDMKINQRIEGIFTNLMEKKFAMN